MRPAMGEGGSNVGSHVGSHGGAITVRALLDSFSVHSSPIVVPGVKRVSTSRLRLHSAPDIPTRELQVGSAWLMG